MARTVRAPISWWRGREGEVGDRCSDIIIIIIPLLDEGELMSNN